MVINLLADAHHILYYNLQAKIQESMMKLGGIHCFSEAVNFLLLDKVGEPYT